MTSDPASGEFDAKQHRLENPSGWISLTRYETVRLLIDALLEAPPGYQFNKSELERRSGVSREAIRDHIDFLVDLGIVEEVTTGSWPEYRLNDDGKVTTELFELNSAVNSVLSGEPKNVQEVPIVRTIEIDYDDDPVRRFMGSLGEMDNSRREQRDDDLIDQPPTKGISSNAD